MKMKNMTGSRCAASNGTFVIDKNGYPRKEWRGVTVPEHARC
jgi:hypothetical protein